MTSASYFKRVIAFFVDGLFIAVPTILLLAVGVGTLVESDGSGFGVASVLLGALWWIPAWIWNKILREGRTGQSLGKSAMRIALVSAETGIPVGAGKTFVREFLISILGSVTLGLFSIVDILFPLFDSKSQRVIDKMLDTQVVAQA